MMLPQKPQQMTLKIYHEYDKLNQNYSLSIEDVVKGHIVVDNKEIKNIGNQSQNPRHTIEQEDREENNIVEDETNEEQSLIEEESQINGNQHPEKKLEEERKQNVPLSNRLNKNKDHKQAERNDSHENMKSSDHAMVRKSLLKQNSTESKTSENELMGCCPWLCSKQKRVKFDL